MLMKRRSAKIIELSLLAAAVAGCAKSDYAMNRQGNRTMHPIEDSRIVNAPISEPPSILPETHLAAGRLFENQGMLGKAVDQYRKAIAVSHDNAVAYHRLGLALSKGNRHDAAIDAFRKAVEISPKNAVLRNDHGFEMMYRNEWGKAESEFRRAIDLDPTLTRAQVNLGLALSKLGRFDDALAAFNSALPEADAYYNLGLMYRAQRRYADAERTFRRVLDMAPEFTAATAQLEQMARGPATTQPETTVVDAARETTPASETADPTPANPGTMPAPTASVAASEPVRHTAADLRTTAEAVANIDETDADTAPCPDVDEGEDPVDSQRALASAEPGPGGPVEPTVTIAAPARTAAGVSYRDRLFELAAALGSVRDEIECLDAVDAERQLVEASKPGLESKPSSDPGAALAKDAMKAKQRKGPGPVTRNAGATGSKPGGDRSNVNGQADSKWTETPWRGLATATGRTERSELYGPPAELAQDAALSRHELVDRPRRPDQVAPLPH